MDYIQERSFQDTFLWYKMLTMNAAGDKTFDIPITVPCLIRGRMGTIITRDGTEVKTNMELGYNGTKYSLSSDDEVEVRGKRLPVLAIDLEPLHNRETQRLGVCWL